MLRSWFERNKSAETLVLVYNPISTWRRRKKYVLAWPSRDAYPFSLLNKIQFSCLTALHTFGRSRLTPFSHYFRSLPGCFKITKQPSELRHITRQRTATFVTNSASCHEYGSETVANNWQIRQRFGSNSPGRLCFIYNEPITKRQRQKEKKNQRFLA